MWRGISYRCMFQVYVPLGLDEQADELAERVSLRPCSRSRNSDIGHG